MIFKKSFWNIKVELCPLSFTTRQSKTSWSKFSGLYREFWTLKMSHHESKSKKNKENLMWDSKRVVLMCILYGI